MLAVYSHQPSAKGKGRLRGSLKVESYGDSNCPLWIAFPMQERSMMRGVGNHNP